MKRKQTSDKLEEGSEESIKWQKDEQHMKEHKTCKTYSVKIILYISERVEGFILKRHCT